MTFADDFALFAAVNFSGALALLLANALLAAGCLLAWRKLPAGVAPAGLATSGAIALIAAFALCGLPQIAAPVSLVAIALPALWFSTRALRAGSAGRDDVDRSVAGGVLLSCGATLIAWQISILAASGTAPLSVRVALVVVALVSLVAAAAAPPWTLLILPCAAAVLLLEFRAGPTLPHADIAALAAGVASIGIVLQHALTGWKRRSREWMDAPAALAERTPLSGGAVITSLAALSGAAALFGGGWSVWAVWASAYAALGVSHLTDSRWAGRIGLLLIAELVVLAAQRWFWGGLPGLLLGFLLASALMLWFARFWRQQVESEPWTTTGKLIPDARALAVGLIAAAAGVAIAQDGFLPAPGSRLAGPLASTLLVLFALANWAFFAADARNGFAATRFGTLLAIVAAAFTLHPLIVNDDLQRWLSPLVTLPAFAFVLSVRNRTAPQPLYRAFSMGALPLILFAALVVQGFTGPLIVALILVLGAAATA